MLPMKLYFLLRVIKFYSLQFFHLTCIKQLFNDVSYVLFKDLLQILEMGNVMPVMNPQRTPVWSSLELRQSNKRTYSKKSYMQVNNTCFVIGLPFNFVLLSQLTIRVLQKKKKKKVGRQNKDYIGILVQKECKNLIDDYIF